MQKTCYVILRRKQYKTKLKQWDNWKKKGKALKRQNEQIGKEEHHISCSGAGKGIVTCI